MPEQRLTCKSLGCERTIQLATSRRNDGYCGPCFNQIQHDKRQAFIRENKRFVDLYEGVTDPTEMLVIAHQRRKHDPLIEYTPIPTPLDVLYTNLSQPQIETMISHAIRAYTEGKTDLGEDIALSLGGFTKAPLTALQTVMIELGQLYPALPFRDADDVVTTLLLEQFSLYETRLELNHLLCCLAWAGSGGAIDFFGEVEHKPPAWADKLSVPLTQYTHEAGWELRDGKRHNLHLQRCFAITPAQNPADANTTLRAMQTLTDTCRWCGRELGDMLCCDNPGESLAPFAIANRQIHVPICEVCTCFTDAGPFIKHTQNTYEWLPVNKKPDYLPDKDEYWGTSPWIDTHLIVSERNITHAANQFLHTDFSQLGGLPAWIQDTSYPACPGCSLTMTFIAQLDNGIFPLCEGTYYAFKCDDCNITATHYSQT